MFRPLPLFLGLRYGASRKGTPLVAFLSRVSAAGLALGVALLIVVLAVMNGFDREMRVSILAMVPHATVHEVYPIHWKQLELQRGHHVRYSVTSNLLMFFARFEKERGDFQQVPSALSSHQLA